MAIFKDGKLVHFIPRYQVESRDAFKISKHLLEAFKEFCSPAVPA
jgi:putative YphP/YqiW family bacilliredoxin